MGVAVTGVKELQKRLGLIADLTKTMPTPLRKSGEFLVRDSIANINKAGHLFNAGGFKQLSKATQQDREREGYNPRRPIMVRTGKLKRSFFYKLTSGMVEIANKTKYWFYHQKGGKKIPRRRLLGIRYEAQVAVGKYFQEQINRLFKIIFR